jgi:phage terminase small subunit
MRAKSEGEPEKLTDKQKRFCDEYLIDNNGTQAAIRAGYAESNARSTASELLGNVGIQDYLAERKAILNKQLEDKYFISKERVLREHARIAFSDIRAFFNQDNSLKDFSELTEDEAASLSSVEVDEIKENFVVVGQTKKIKVYDKKGSLAEIAKIMGYYAPVKTDHTTKGESLNSGFYALLKKASTKAND